MAISLVASMEGQGGGPVLVLGNSLGTSRSVWEPQVAAFRRHFRLLRYEHPGHGGAPAPAGPYTIGELGAGVLAVLDAHRVERAYYCGISLGGMIGMWLAAHAPERIAALGLCCTSAFLPPASGWTGRARQVRQHGTASITEQSIARWFTPLFRATDPAVPAALAAELEATDPEGYAGCCEAIAAMDLRSSLAAVQAPALVIAGAEDPATPPAHGAVIASGIAGSRLMVVRGAAHLANVSAAAQVTYALLGGLLGPSLA